MTKRFLLPMLFISLLLHTCSAPTSPPLEQDNPTTPVSQPGSLELPTEPSQATVPDPTQETALPDCLGGAVSPVGQSIADEYDFTSYEEVITWFCNGAEFEDILVALETESQTGAPTEEMLQMLADGFTWEEIWGLIGLTE